MCARVYCPIFQLNLVLRGVFILHFHNSAFFPRFISRILIDINQNLVTGSPSPLLIVVHHYQFQPFESPVRFHLMIKKNILLDKKKRNFSISEENMAMVMTVATGDGLGPRVLRVPFNHFQDSFHFHLTPFFSMFKKFHLVFKQQI